jgi:hypothetical protein
MRRRTLNSLLGVLVVGLGVRASAQPVQGGGMAYCYVCVSPNVCPYPYVWDEICQQGCGFHFSGVGCSVDVLFCESLVECTS